MLKLSRLSGGKAKIGIDGVDFFIKYFARIKPPIISPITTVKLFSSISIVEKLFTFSYTPLLTYGLSFELLTIGLIAIVDEANDIYYIQVVDLSNYG